MKQVFNKKNSPKIGSALLCTELQKGMIVTDLDVKRFVTKVDAGKVYLTGIPPIVRTNDIIKYYILVGWYSGKLKEIKKGATFFLDGHFYIKGNYKKSLKSYECTMKNIDHSAEIYVKEDTIVTI